MSNFIELTDNKSDRKIAVAIDSIRVVEIYNNGEGTIISFKNIPFNEESIIVKENYRDLKHNLMING